MIFLYNVSVVREYTQCQLKVGTITSSTYHTVNIVKITYFSKIPPQELLVSFFPVKQPPPSTFSNKNEACLNYRSVPSHTHFFQDACLHTLSE